MPNGRDMDMDAWDMAGRRLAAVDPSRFAAVLEIVERAVQLHESPGNATLDPESCVPSEDAG